MKTKKITIILDEEHSPEETVSEVARLLADGFTSGYNPDWDMYEEDV